MVKARSMQLTAVKCSYFVEDRDLDERVLLKLI
jgi:hypothetical protein